MLMEFFFFSFAKLEGLRMTIEGTDLKEWESWDVGKVE